MESILEIIKPSSIADIFIYIILIMSVIVLAVMPEKNEQPQYLMFAVIFLSIIDLVRNEAPSGTFPIPGLDDNGFATYLIHIMMAIFPMVAGGMARKQGRKGGATLPLGVLTGLIAGVYAVASFIRNSPVYDKILDL
jgi:hypothetical protein